MRRLLAALLVAAGLFVPSFSSALTPIERAAVLRHVPAASSGFSASCTESSNFIARTSGLSNTVKTNIDTFICGGVSDGWWAKLDLIYYLGAPDSTTALLNMVGNTFNGTANGSPTFTACSGFTGTEGSSTVYIDTGFNPTTASSPKFTQNSAHISGWNLTNATSDRPIIGISATGGTTLASQIYPKFSDGNSYMRINDGTPSGGTASPGPVGFFISNRSGASATQGYFNGSSFITPNVASGGSANVNFAVLGTNDVVNGHAALGSGDKVALVSIGSSLSAGDATNFYNRANTLLAATCP